MTIVPYDVNGRNENKPWRTNPAAVRHAQELGIVSNRVRFIPHPRRDKREFAANPGRLDKPERRLTQPPKYDRLARFWRLETAAPSMLPV